MQLTNAALNNILNTNACFDSVDELRTAITTTSYRPSIRCDLDPRLMAVVEKLAEDGLDARCYVYFKGADGKVRTCWGVPERRRMALSFKAPEQLTARERIELRDLNAALKPNVEACEDLAFLKGWATPRNNVSAPKAAFKALDRAVSAECAPSNAPAKLGRVFALTLDNGRVVQIAIRMLSSSRARVIGKAKRIEWLGNVHVA